MINSVIILKEATDLYQALSQFGLFNRLKIWLKIILRCLFYLMQNIQKPITAFTLLTL